MALPEGVTTATVTAGVPVSHTGAPVKAFLSIEPSVFLVHTATGTPLVDFLEELSINEGVAGQFTLPHTDQAGFQDENGNAYTNWYYTARITYSTPSKAKTKAPKIKVFQLATGQTLVDLDSLPGGAPALPYTAPIATVTSVNGRTGAVTIEDGDLPERLSEESLDGAYALKGEAADFEALDEAYAVPLDALRVDRRGETELLTSVAAAKLRYDVGITAPGTDNVATADGKAARIRFPANVDNRIPLPLVIMCSGAGHDGALPEASLTTPATALLGAGFAVASVQMAPDNYGNDKAMAEALALYRAACDMAPINGVLLFGNSMGGLTAQNLVTTNTLPNVLGMYLTEPVWDMRQRYDNGRYTEITNAYGLAADGSDYATKTAGHDPSLRDRRDFRGVPIRLVSSPGDTGVLQTLHADKLFTRLSGFNQISRRYATGNHGDPSHFDTADIVTTFKAWAGNAFSAKPPLLADWDASKLALTDGATIASWAPVEGSMTAPLTATTGQEANYVASFEGKPVVRLGAGDMFDSGAWPELQGVPLTVAGVFNTSGDAQFWTGRSGVYVNCNISLNPAVGSTYLHVGAGATNELNAFTTRPTGWMIIVAVYNGTASRLYFNSLTPFTGTTGTGNAAALPGIKVGTGSSNGTTGGAAFDIARLRIIKGAMSDAGAKALIKDLATKYAVTLV